MLNLAPPTGFATPRQRGLSLVELMVGIAVGLFVVAAAAMLVATQLGDNRRLLLETQMQQDLRAAVDIVVRDLRRAQYWSQSWLGVAAAGSPAVKANPYGTPAISGSSGANQILYSYLRDTGATSFGFKLDNGVLRARQADGGWQDLTDPAVLRVTSFSVDVDRPGGAAVPANADAQVLPCVKLCPDGTANCWPALRVRQVVVTLTAQAVGDPSFVRTVSAGVRLRNDHLDLDPTLKAADRTCPG